MAEDKKTAAPEQLRKITGKDVCTDAEGKSMLGPVKKETPLFTICGVIKSLVGDTSTFGPYVKFKGDFLASRIDGKMFRSSSFIAPPPLDDILEQQFLASIDPATGESVDCQFSAQIGIKHHAGDKGYMWYAKPLVEMQPNDVLMSLMNQSQAVLKLEKK